MTFGQAVLVASETAPGLLQRVGAEIDCGTEVCRVTKFRHLQHLWGIQENTW